MSVLDLLLPREQEDFAVVLLEPGAGPKTVRNLVMVGDEARVQWRGELPASGVPDCFLSVALEDDGALSTTTWSGFRVRLDLKTGRLLGASETR